jgi:Metallo-peptidase family M12B Reprolysin-like/Cadherin domain/IPT/TIG domain
MTHQYLLRSLALTILLGLPGLLRAQQRAAAPVRWQPETVAAARLLAASPFAGRLAAYRAVSTDRATLVAALATAPLEGSGQAPLLFTLPTPDGGTARFQVVESSVMEPGLAAQFPDIKTYAGIGLDDPTATLRADITPQGFHAQVLSRQPGRTFYLDPVSRAQPTTCLSYWRQDLTRPAGNAPRPCGVQEPEMAANRAYLERLMAAQAGSSHGGNRVQTSLGTQLRTYRVCVAATGEYTAFCGGTVPLAQAAIVTSVNRVTGVYEKELAVRLVLIATNSSVVYTNAATDPYTNNNGTTMLTQNQTNLTSVIGAANYDIGHVFSTGGGGVASLGSVCVAARKAQGVTGSPAPVADAFDIDYVAHEMGHQFGGNHPFNGSVGSCTGGNRNGSTAWETGSGSTIMGYAGICDGSALGSISGGTSQDLQLHSDPYFHGGNISEMTTFINSTSCITPVSSGNTPPSVSTPTAKSIPASTPFKLTGAATDAEADALTYCWEEMDLGAQGAPVIPTTTQTANSTVPLFRSWNPTSNPVRYFPRLTDLRNNTYSYGEMLPTVARTLNFRLTVRDEHFSTALGRIVGGINQSNTLALTVVNTGAAFAVTAPNTAVSWTGGSTQSVTWNVAGTTANGINSATVNIRLSTDGGLTYPTTLATGVANSGTASVTIPNIATTTARVMVESADNYFFDISNTNFTITLSGGPIITSFTPTSGPIGTVVTITGSNFTGSTAVAFNGTAASGFTVNSATQITATVAAGTSTGFITVTNGVGTGTSSTTFVVPQVPTVTSFTPTSGAIGSSVVVTGTGFTGVTAVNFNGTAAATYTVNSATQITVTVPTGATTGPISVTNGLGTGTSSTNFTVLTTPANDLCTAASLPVLTCGTSVTGTTLLSTSTGDPTANCNAVTIQAASGGVFYRFTGTGGSVTMNTCNAGTNYDTKLFVYTGTCGALTCVTGNDDLTGTCAANGTTTTSTVTFATTLGTSYLVFVSGYNGEQGNFVLTTTCVSTTPTITSFTPTSGPVGTVVTITGTNLTGLTGVSFNGTAAVTFSATNATTATATVPAGATTGTISLTTPGGSATSATSFTVAPAPTITSFTPTSGPVGTVVTITGTNLTGLTGVTFNTTAAVTFTAVNATTATATVPTGATTGTIKATTAGGTATSATSFTVTAPPTITSFTPTSGPTGTSVTITGTNLTGLTAVSFNGTAAVTFSATNATTATATVPTGATTGTISVSTPNGSATSATSFTVTTPPANDLCTAPNLPVLTCGGTVTGTTLNSTSTGDPTGTCTAAINATAGGVFYLFTGTGGSVTVSTCNVGTDFNTKLFVFSGSCGSLTCVGGNNNSAACSAATNASIVTFTATAGTQYYVFVSGNNNARGNFVLTATCANVAPTNLALAPASVAENAPVNTTVGSFTSTDANPGNTFTYSLVTGTGSGDNGSFNISGSTLRTSASFDYETRNSYNIRVRTTDQGGLTFDKALVVSITDVAEGPGLTSIAPTAELPGATVTLTGTGFTGATGVSFNGTPATSFTVVSGTQITAMVPAGATTGPVTVSNAAGAGNGVAFTVYAVFNSVTNSCQSSTSISSTGAGQWQYLLIGSEVVAAFNDQGTALGTITASLIVTTGAPRIAPGGKEVFNRSWRLTAQNGFNGHTVRVRFYGLNTEFSAYLAANDGDGSDVQALADLQVQQYGGANEDCDLANNVLPPAADVRVLPLTITQLSNTNFFRAEAAVADHFSEFYLLGDPGAPLPVTLTRLHAQRTASGVEVTWATASEKDNAGWYIERSNTSGSPTDFATTSTLLAGAGNSLAPHAYAWTDASAPASALAYRLRQLDANGTSSVSAAVTVAALTKAPMPLALTPNPTHGALRISGLPSGMPLTIVDAIGRTVRQLTETSNGTADFDLTGLAPGVYTVRAGAATARLAVE